MREIVSPLDGIRSPFGSAVSPLAIYAVLGRLPQLALDFDGEKYFTGGSRSTFADAITFSRASSATYADASGVLQTAASGVPRIGHHVWNGSAWVNEGLLHESEARTNLLAYSEDFSDVSWTKQNTAALAVDATGPDGETSAVTLVDSGATGSGTVYALNTVTVSTATTYTFSVFAKSDQLSWFRITLANFTTPVNTSAYFNLADGIVGSTGSGLTPRIEDYGSGWYRCSVAFTTDTTDTSGSIGPALASGDLMPTVDLDGTSSILIYGAQFEAGPTPSSYIPTAGSTATRAAETLTVPSANLPWPTPVVIGPELVTNGTFDTDVSGWTGRNANTQITLSSNKMLVTAGAADVAYAYQQITATSGKVYRLTLDYEQVQNISRIYVGVGTGTNTYYDSGNLSGAGSIDIVFVPTSDNPIISLYASVSSTLDDASIYDNISVREIDPLAVSIQMQGRATGDTYTTTRWYLDANNYITQEINTSDFTFEQAASGTVDAVTGGSFTSGVNTPFNIASRHGSTFINGAVDGTALTANTTPTALPDLSATDLSLGYDYNGTIKMLRIWADDLTDAGLEAASS